MLTFKDAFTKALALGEHTLRVAVYNGELSTTFTLTRSEEEPSETTTGENGDGDETTQTPDKTTEKSTDESGTDAAQDGDSQDEEDGKKSLVGSLFSPNTGGHQRNALLFGALATAGIAAFLGCILRKGRNGKEAA